LIRDHGIFLLFVFVSGVAVYPISGTIDSGRGTPTCLILRQINRQKKVLPGRARED
jgi:hypothetical protein